MKKILSFLLCVTVILQCFIAVTADGASGSAAYSDAISFLQSFNILEKDRDFPENAVSRQDFALYIGRMLKLDELEVTNVRYFYDVDTDGYNTSIINALVDAGIISQNAEGTFRPNEQITKHEAFKMILCALGYGDYCEVSGGFPVGYIKGAVSLGLDTQNNLLTVTDAAELIYDAMRAPMYMVTGYEEDMELRVSDPTKTILTVYWGTKVEEGMLSASYLGACEGQMVDDEKRICVGGKWYDLAAGVEADGFLASYVRIFYDKVTEDVVIIEEINKTAPISIAAEDFLSFNKSRLEYYTESGQRSSITLEDAYIIYNGMPLEKDVTATLSGLKKGYVTVKDANNDDNYDVVLIEDYSTVIVSAMDMNTEKIYNELDTVPIELKDYTSVKLQKASGALAEASAIAKGSVLSVARSKNNEVIRIIIEDNIADGVLERFKASNAEYEVCFADKWYEADGEYALANQVLFEHGLKTGEKYTYVIDSFGKLVYLKASEESRGKLGYIIDIVEDGVFDKEVTVYMLTEDNEISKLLCAERLNIDGTVLKKFGKQDVKNEISDTADVSGDIGQLVRYIVKGEKLAEVDTRQYVFSEDENDTLTATFNETSSQKWFLNNRFMIKGIIEGGTIAFCIPFDPATASAEDYCVVANTQAVTNNGYYYADTYRMHRSPGVAKAIVLRYKEDGVFKNYNANQKTFLIDEIMSGIDDDGNELTIISGYENGAKKEYSVLKENVALDALEKGDLVKFSYDVHGNPIKTAAAPNGYIMLYDKSVGGLPDRTVWTGMGTTEQADTGRTLFDGSATAATSYYNVAFQLSFGYASDAAEGIVGWSWREKTKDPEKISEYVNCSSIPIIIIEDGDKDVNIYRGKVDDINTYAKAGENCSRIICHAYSNNIRALYVYK